MQPLYLDLVGLPITSESLQRPSGTMAERIDRAATPSAELPMSARPYHQLDTHQASAHGIDFLSRSLGGLREEWTGNRLVGSDKLSGYIRAFRWDCLIAAVDSALALTSIS